MTKPDIVIQLPAFTKNKAENKIEIHKDVNAHEKLQVVTPSGKRKTSKRHSVKPMLVVKKRKGVSRSVRGKKGKKGGSISSRLGSFFNFTRRMKENAVTSSKDAYTYIFGKVAVMKDNVMKMVDGVKIYKNNEHQKDIVLQKNYIPNLFAMAKQRFSRKAHETGEKIGSMKTRFVDSIRNARIIIQQDSTFYNMMNKALHFMENHKRSVYAIIAFILISVFILFVPFTGVMLFTLVPFAFAYLMTGASVVFYSAVGGIESAIIAPAAAGFSSTIVSGTEYAAGEVANFATQSVP